MTAPGATMRTLALFVTFAALPTGCASYLFAPPLDAPSEEAPPEVSRSDRFLGTWLVDQPSHATYEASFYELDARGGVTHLFTEVLWESAGDFEVGVVAIEEPCPSAVCPRVTCRFGDAWRSDGEATLLIDGVCDDGSSREIELAFEGEREGNAAGMTFVDVVRVGDETEHVFHPGFEWRFLRCLDEDGRALADEWGCEPLGETAKLP